jgi:hypothetical protein
MLLMFPHLSAGITEALTKAQSSPELFFGGVNWNQSTETAVCYVLSDAPYYRFKGTLRLPSLPATGNWIASLGPVQAKLSFIAPL